MATIEEGVLVTSIINDMSQYDFIIHTISTIHLSHYKCIPCVLQNVSVRNAHCKQTNF